MTWSRWLLVPFATSIAWLPALASVTTRSAQPPVPYAAERLRAELAAAGARLDVVISVDGSVVGPESYRLTRADDGTILVAGADPRGAMYGSFELAERVRCGGDVSFATPVRGQPYLRHRQHRIRFPSLPARLPATEPGSEPFWFADRAFWEQYLDALAWDRYNELSLWHRCPFQFLVNLSQYPEASAFAPGEFAKWRGIWSMIFALAKERGIDTTIGNWNIEVPEAFARVHGVATKGSLDPVVVDYTRQAVRDLLRGYPDLTGIGACPGEDMPGMSNRAKEQWIWDAIVGGIIASGCKGVPLQHRSWGLGDDAGALEESLARRYAGPLYVDLKYNGEHMYSSTKPHFVREAWLKPTNHFETIWHLRNDCLQLYPWGDPAFVRELLRHAKQGNATGFLMGSEFEQPGPGYARIPTSSGGPKYEFQRDWFRLALWGRLAYDPATPDALWASYHTAQCGDAGRAILAATEAASKIIPLVQQFHFQYLGGWRPELNAGGDNGDEPRGSSYLDAYEFHSVLEWIFHHPLDDAMVTIPEWALHPEGAYAGRQTPPQVASEIEWAARECLQQLGDTSGQTATELRCLATLGLYYAEKLRGAAELGLVAIGGERDRRAAAVRHLRAAQVHWQELVTLAEGTTDAPMLYRRYLPDVEADVGLARQVKAAPGYYAALGLFRPDRVFADGDLTRVEPPIAGSVPELSSPLADNPRFGLDPERYGALIICPGADGFDRLREGVKQRLLRGLLEGQRLLIFEQDRGFRYDWAGAGISVVLAPKDSAGCEARLVGQHPLARQLAATGARLRVGGTLLAVGGEWESLTDPPLVAVRRVGAGEIIAVQAGIASLGGGRGAREALATVLRYAADSKTALIIDKGNSDLTAKLRTDDVEFRMLHDGLAARMRHRLGPNGERAVIATLVLLGGVASLAAARLARRRR